MFLQVNGTGMAGISHVDAVDVLKGITDRCHLVVSREVLIVLPEDMTSPPPGEKAKNGEEKVASPPAEDQPPDQVKTSPPVQSENAVSSPPPEGQGNKTSPPPGDEANKISPPPQSQLNIDAIVTTTLSKSMEELRAFKEQLSHTANTVHDDELIVEQVVEQQLESAPQLEIQPGYNVDVEVKVDDAKTDLAQLEEFAEQLRRSEQEKREKEMVNLNEEGTVTVETGSADSRDNYVNYDIAQAVILANSDVSTGSGDHPAGESGEQLENSEVFKSKVATTGSVVTGESEVEVKKSNVEEKQSEMEDKKNETEGKKSPVAPVIDEVVLPHGTGPLGMNIVGGSDRSSFPFGKGLPGVFISKVCIVLLVVHVFIISQ